METLIAIGEIAAGAEGGHDPRIEADFVLAGEKSRNRVGVRAAGRNGEKVCVGVAVVAGGAANSAMQGVVAGAAVERVKTALAVKEVVSRAAVEEVMTGKILSQVKLGVADDR